jgi:hypothetical protein
MLRGHETLLRLVGKRRKLHPSTLSLSPVKFTSDSPFASNNLGLPHVD